MIMIESDPIHGYDGFEAQPAPEVSATARQLRSLALRRGWRLGGPERKLVEELLEAAAEAERRIAAQQARIRYLEDLSVTDELTGLLNRRGLRRELERALARARRHGETGVLLLFDLNHFKPVNDSFGHPAGDAVLRAVAGLLSERTRRSDYVARLGGDEFAVLMTGTSPARAAARGRKLAGRVNRLEVAWGEVRIPVSAGFGLDAYDRTSRPDRLLARADRALYRDKQPHLREAV
jgi:diguanylate cyclase (GGDEF)-like protein